MNPFQLPGLQPMSYREDREPAIEPEVKDELVEDAFQGEQNDTRDQEEVISDETSSFATLEPMYDVDAPTKRNKSPLHPFTTKFPVFPPIPNRVAPHPLDKTSWYDPSLTLPPPQHLLTLDDGKSLFDVNFRRQRPNHLGGNGQEMKVKNARLLCPAGWHAPHQIADGGPYFILSAENWFEYDDIRPVEEAAIRDAKENGAELKPTDGAMSLFYGGGDGHPNMWRYRGDIKFYKKYEIGPNEFARMGKKRKLSGSNTFVTRASSRASPVMYRSREKYGLHRTRCFNNWLQKVLGSSSSFFES
ncbi:uncharacterized protein JCM6883_000366 [Sporobolomyces salmoneus]|uniref:uncharacterized protein n=1 Tax=Sporobolomyces salmoneus TaxID=183962 RepID=UPI0031779C47